MRSLQAQMTKNKMYKLLFIAACLSFHHTTNKSAISLSPTLYPAFHQWCSGNKYVL